MPVTLCASVKITTQVLMPNWAELESSPRAPAPTTVSLPSEARLQASCHDGENPSVLLKMHVSTRPGTKVITLFDMATRTRKDESQEEDPEDCQPAPAQQFSAKAQQPPHSHTFRVVLEPALDSDRRSILQSFTLTSLAACTPPQ